MPRLALLQLQANPLPAKHIANTEESTHPATAEGTEITE